MKRCELGANDHNFLIWLKMATMSGTLLYTWLVHVLLRQDSCIIGYKRTRDELNRNCGNWLTTVHIITYCIRDEVIKNYDCTSIYCRYKTKQIASSLHGNWQMLVTNTEKWLEFFCIVRDWTCYISGGLLLTGCMWYFWYSWYSLCFIFRCVWF